MYYRGAEAAVLVYDITNRSSFERIRDYWVSELQRSGPEHIILTLAGNKADLDNSSSSSSSPSTASPSTHAHTHQRQVAVEEGRALAAAIGAAFTETSAKEDRGIAEAFQEVGRRIISKHSPASASSSAGTGSVRLGGRPDDLGESFDRARSENSSSGGCC